MRNKKPAGGQWGEKGHATNAADKKKEDGGKKKR